GYPDSVPGPTPSRKLPPVRIGGQGRIELPTFRFSGVIGVQVLRHYQRVDGCWSAPMVATGCRRCRHRCRQPPPGHPVAPETVAGLDVCLLPRLTEVGVLLAATRFLEDAAQLSDVVSYLGK